jgi:hypothetical protein
MRKPWFRNRIDRVLALGELQDAMGRAEASDAPVPPAPVRLEDGTRITAVTDGGQAVGGRVVRVWQTFADSQAGTFRVLCAPAADDSSDEEGQAS